jgi:CheY-like chemotaxis protein
MTGEVLIAEDDVDMQELIQRSLPDNVQREAVRFFHDGREILDYLFRLGQHRDTRRQIPRLIVIDLDMPTVNGRAVVSILKSDERFKGIPAIILTGNEALQDRLLDLGADGYYVKPIDLMALKNLMSDIMKKWLN